MRKSDEYCYNSYITITFIRWNSYLVLEELVKENIHLLSKLARLRVTICHLFTLGVQGLDGLLPQLGEVVLQSVHLLVIF